MVSSSHSSLSSPSSHHLLQRADVGDTPTEPVVLGQIDTGDLFGELSFILSQSTSASVIADDDCEISVIPVPDLLALFARVRWKKKIFFILRCRLNFFPQRKGAEARFYLEITTMLHHRMQKRERVVYPKYSAGASAIIRRSGSQVLRNQIVKRDNPGVVAGVPATTL